MPCGPWTLHTLFGRDLLTGVVGVRLVRGCRGGGSSVDEDEGLRRFLREEDGFDVTVRGGTVRSEYKILRCGIKPFAR